MSELSAAPPAGHASGRIGGGSPSGTTGAAPGASGMQAPAGAGTESAWTCS